jgi:sodium/potassium-transporting ATPase subunit alpha
MSISLPGVVCYRSQARTLSIHVTDSIHGPAPVNAKKDTNAVKELAELDWHTLSKDEVLQRLSASGTSGLDTEQAKRRLATNGPNEVKPHKPNVFLK